MIKKFLNIAIWTAAAGILAAQTAALFGMQHWILELFTHYIHYYTMASAILILPAILMRRNLTGNLACMIFALAIAINLPLLAPYLIATEPALPDHKSETLESEQLITILTSNFFYKNDEFGEFSELLSQENPDIFIIHEASELWRIDPKSQFHASHPYEYKSTESGVSGIFVASKLPANFQEIPLGSKFGVEITLKGTSDDPDDDEEKDYDKTLLTILAVHPPAPITAEYAAERNAQMKDIALYAEEIMTTGSELIITGDFNCTPFSPYFQEMLTASGLQDARLKAGSGILTTWHAHNPLFRIPIDHTLSSPGITVLDFRRTAALSGSDHWPVLAKILLP